MVVELLACVAPPTALAPPVLTRPPDLAYSRQVTLSFDREVWIDGEATDGTHTIPIAAGPSRKPSFPLVGLYADRRWTVTLEARDLHGTPVSVEPFEFTTQPLPPEMPRIELLANEPGAEPGYTLVPFVSVGPLGWLVVLDAEGEVAWTWADGGYKFLEAIAVEDGLIAMHGNHEIAEIGWAGEPRRRLVIEEAVDDGGVEVAAPMFHHELAVLDDGSWLTLTVASREVEAFPVAYDLLVERPARVIADTLLVLDPDDGAILQSLDVGRDLDPTRIGYGSLSGSPEAGGYSWTHANAACADDQGRWIVSLRHQDAVIALDRATGALEWILGTPDNWTPEYEDLRLAPVGEPFAWQWHQHAVKCLGDGRFLLFDNGNYGASPRTGVPLLPAEETRSRVVEYRVDADAMTVSQAWSYEPEQQVFSVAMGDADELPGGTVLATFAFVRYLDGQIVTDLGRGHHSFQLHELEPATGRLLWGVDVWADPSAPVPAWRSYRASRFASFGPGGPAP